MMGLQCAHCGQALALADEACPHCQTPVPVAERRGLLLQRAETLAQDGRPGDGARALLAVLATGPAVVEAKGLWRKRSLWLQKADGPRALDEAEAALVEALKLDDADDLSHQLWMDLLKRRGQQDKAQQWYKQRIQADPGDAMAARQLAVLRLTSDVLLNHQRPKLDLGRDAKPTLLQRWLKPTTWKLFSAGLACLTSLGTIVWSMKGGTMPGLTPGTTLMDPVTGMPLAGLGATGGLGSILMDPWVNGLQALIFGVYLWWGLRHRHD